MIILIQINFPIFSIFPIFQHFSRISPALADLALNKQQLLTPTLYILQSLVYSGAALFTSDFGRYIQVTFYFRVTSQPPGSPVTENLYKLMKILKNKKIAKIPF